MSSSSSENVIRKTKTATKFSVAAELLTKIIVPVNNMILARILAPEAFGAIATILVITSFTDIFTDAGFQKYLIQQEFDSEDDFKKHTNVAFIANLAASLLFWAVISIFSTPLAKALGNETLDFAIIIALLQLPITAFSSIQTAVFRRALNFKILLISRVAVALTPLIITVPLALLGFDYWSLVIGNLAGKIISAIILTVKSPWKPTFYFDFQVLKSMLSKSMMLMLETISKWFCDYYDIIIIGAFISQYYLGLYRNSYQMVNSILTLFSVSMIPVLLSSLSKLTRDSAKFHEVYSSFQKTLAYILLPLGFGMMFYRGLAVDIILGDQWSEAANIFGVVAISLAIKLIFVDVINTIFIAKGRPKLSVAMNFLYLLIVTPITIWAAKEQNFWTYLYIKNILVLVYIGTGLLLVKKYHIIKASNLLKNIVKPLFATATMSCFILIAKHFLPATTGFEILSIGISIVIYLGVALLIDRNFFKKWLKSPKKIQRN